MGLFGPSKREIWRRLSHELGARHVPATFWNGDRIEVTHDAWTITLDTYFSAASKSTYTRLRAPYVNPDDFRFTVYRRGLFSDLATWLGMQDVDVGHPEFDRDFVIKGTHEGRLRRLFENPAIRRLIDAQRSIHFSVHDRRGDGPSPATDELRFVVPGVIKDEARLRELFELFAETLDELHRMGTASGHAP
jgi:hypothetical protein